MAPDQHARGLTDVGSDQYAVLIFMCHFNKMKGSEALFILLELFTLIWHKGCHCVLYMVLTVPDGLRAVSRPVSGQLHLLTAAVSPGCYKVQVHIINLLSVRLKEGVLQPQRQRES